MYVCCTCIWRKGREGMWRKFKNLRFFISIFLADIFERKLMVFSWFYNFSSILPSIIFHFNPIFDIYANLVSEWRDCGMGMKLLNYSTLLLFLFSILENNAKYDMADILQYVGPATCDNKPLYLWLSKFSKAHNSKWFNGIIHQNGFRVIVENIWDENFTNFSLIWN